MNSRKKRIYGSVIGLCVLGVIVDRLAAPPAPAAASAVRRRPSRSVAEKPDHPPSANEAEPAPGAVIAAARFPDRLAGWGLPGRDLFSPTDPARRALIGQGDSGEDRGRDAPGVAPSAMLAEQFRSSHVLLAVVQDSDFAVAVVDGKWVRVGEEFEGCALLRIEGQAAIFDCGGIAVELSVDHGLGVDSPLKTVEAPVDDSPGRVEKELP